jgi:phage shock protein E
MKANFILAATLLAITVVAAADCRAEEEEVTHTKTPLTEIKKAIDDDKAWLVDCREIKEWEDGHLTDAHFMPLSKLKESKDTASVLPKDKPIYVHCAVGVRALAAAKILKKMGYYARPIKATPDQLIKDGGFKEALKTK